MEMEKLRSEGIATYAYIISILRVNWKSDLKESLSTKLQKSLAIYSEKGASSWLSALPISEHGFALHKGAAFRYACSMVGNHRTYHLTVTVGNTSREDSHRFDITKFATSLPTLCLP